MSLNVYISGPMTGIEQFNYPEFFDVESKLAEQRFTVLNPARVDEQHAMHGKCGECDYGRKKHDWRWYMRRCIVLLADADGVATLRGWQQSKGATAEVALAQALGLPVMPWQSWVLRAIQEDDPTMRPGVHRIRRGEGEPKELIVHMLVEDGRGMRTFCGTKGNTNAAKTEEWDLVNCQRCIKKKRGRA